MSAKTIKAALKRLGYDSFQPGQYEAIEALVSGRDVLTVMPTGGGKSLIYQVAAEIVDGLVLVISPLIALMKDQADAAVRQGQPAAVINSHIGAVKLRTTLEEAAAGSVGLLYITPERLQNEAFVTWLHAQQIGLIVVDEAHCISEWGHDFRPAYTAIGRSLRDFGAPLTLALTATATQFVVTDITEQLGMKEALVIRQSIDRPNLFYGVLPVAHEEDKPKVILELLRAQHKLPANAHGNAAKIYAGSGIVYTATTADAEQLATYLQAEGIEAGRYHGQLRKDEREQAQEDFMADKTRVMVATNAFGMGIDKPDVSFVIHYDVPPNIESYYQEAGRAGRDGQSASCMLLYRSEDMGKAGFMAGTGDEERKIYEQGRQEMMRRYAEQHTCRRAFLLHYFGEDYQKARCNNCDADFNKPSSDTVKVDHHEPDTDKDTSANVTTYRINDTVRHKAWGNGTIQSVESDTVTVLFEAVGHKVFDLQVISEQKLLIKAKA